jgi:magnesium transporter
LKDIENSRIVSLKPKSTLKQALALFERYDYRAIPIVDHHGKILGVVPYRDLKKLKHRFFE